MISIKRYLESREGDLYQLALESYRDAIVAMQQSGAQAHPQLAEEFQRSLTALRQHLDQDVTAEVLTKTKEQLEKELTNWGEKANVYLQLKTKEVKEIVLALARMTSQAADRDDKLAVNLTDFTTRLENIAGLDDLTAIRAAVLTSAGDLKSYAEHVRAESQESISALRNEILQYQNRLEQAEQLATQDALTGLANRRGMELALAGRLRSRRQFVLALFDLNGFKKVNDELGHNAGDDLLRQFAQELKGQLRAADMVGRWGGDEFVALLDCGLPEAQQTMERVAKWVFGDYNLHIGGVTHRVSLTASIAWPKAARENRWCR